MRVLYNAQVFDAALSAAVYPLPGVYLVVLYLLVMQQTCGIVKQISLIQQEMHHSPRNTPALY